MKIPNAERAIVDIAKLRDYCLNPAHSEGKHKARVFASALGLSSNDAEFLRDTLLDVVETENAALGEVDEYGQRYTLDFEMTTDAGRAVVRSGWIIRADEDYPRFVTCYVL